MIKKYINSTISMYGILWNFTLKKAQSLFVEMGSSGVTVMEGGLSETGGTVVIPDWNGCGLQPLQRTEAAGRFLRCGLVICVLLCDLGQLCSPNVSCRQNLE